MLSLGHCFNMNTGHELIVDEAKSGIGCVSVSIKDKVCTVLTTLSGHIWCSVNNMCCHCGKLKIRFVHLKTTNDVQMRL